MAWNSLGLTALYLGVADAARDWLLQFLAERTPASLGRPLATLARFQTDGRGDQPAALISAGALVNALAARVDAGDRGRIAQAGVAQAHRHPGRDRRRGAGRGPGRQQRPDPA